MRTSASLGEAPWVIGVCLQSQDVRGQLWAGRFQHSLKNILTVMTIHR